jgi:hypothetical protein
MPVQVAKTPVEKSSSFSKWFILPSFVQQWKKVSNRQDKIKGKVGGDVIPHLRVVWRVSVRIFVIFGKEMCFSSGFEFKKDSYQNDIPT